MDESLNFVIDGIQGPLEESSIVEEDEDEVCINGIFVGA